VLISDNIFVSDDFADKYSAISNFSLVNKPDLTRMLKSEIFVHKDEQLKAAHLILGYEPLLSSFQSPKYVIKVRDPRLHQINIVVPGFLVTSPNPEGVQQIKLSFQCIAEEATPSQSTIKEEEKEERVEVSNSKNDFKVFNQPQSLEVPASNFSHIPPA